MNREVASKRRSVAAPRRAGFRKLWKRYREMNCSEERFADYCGISRQTIFKYWFRDDRKPNWKSIGIIRERTGIDISEAGSSGPVARFTGTTTWRTP